MIGEARVPGRVTVRVTVSATPAQIWEALTSRDVVRRWFGELSASLRPGIEARLDFGDGDFFSIVDVRATPPGDLRYTWRFLGTGPPNEIAWRIDSHDDYRVITMTDDEPFRSAKGVEEMTEGWTDFLDRLSTYLSTGTTTRYDWRRDFEGSIELPVSASSAVLTLFSSTALKMWLPFAGAVPGEHEIALLCDGHSPERFAMSGLPGMEPFEIHFQLMGGGWRSPTYCRLAIGTHGNNAILDVRHVGWEGISGEDSYCMAQRKRFGDHWISALKAAAALLRCDVTARVQIPA